MQCHPLNPVPTLSPSPRGTDTDNHHLRFFFPFFQFSLETQSSQLLSTDDTFSVGKGGDCQGDTPIPHWSLMYRAQDSSWQVVHQSPPVDGKTRLYHHSRPHAGSLGTTRPSDSTYIICALTAEHEWLEGVRVRAPIGLKNKSELNWARTSGCVCFCIGGIPKQNLKEEEPPFKPPKSLFIRLKPPNTFIAPGGEGSYNQIPTISSQLKIYSWFDHDYRKKDQF